MESNKKNKITLNNKYKNMDSKIQIITSPKQFENTNYGETIRISYFYNYDSVDSYKYNIIDLSDSKLWNYDASRKLFTNSEDITTLINAIHDNECKSEFIIMMPVDLGFKIESFSTNYAWLRNEPKIINKFLNEYFNLSDLKLVYGMNDTKLGTQTFEAGFHIKLQNPNYKILTKNTNDKITTIKRENLILTTLQLTNRVEVINFIEHTLLEKEIDIPDWFGEIEMFDDILQKERISNNNLKIEELNEDNEIAEDILNENNEYKSILYKQSKPLVKSVFKILEDMLTYDLSDFVDVFKEDFLIKFENVTFIGEIKGVSRNVTRKHLSQTDDHVSEREDLLEEKGETENIQPLLIINRFIDLPPSERPEVDKTTIKKAEEKYKILIITTEELLKLYETYKKGEITSEEIIERFKNEIGLFKL